MIGETIRQYRVLEHLGSGGMGEVFLAVDEKLHRRVALKLLRAGDGDRGEAEARFLREARAAAALSHPNVAVVYEIGEFPAADGPRSFLAMELVAGPTLATWVRQESPCTAEILDLVRQVADALAVAHDLGIVHRDIKPSNILVAPGRRAKVTDFGLAKRIPLVDGTPAEGDPLSRADVVLGTVSYMSPEQARNEPVDGRTDIFSLGVLLYELLCGRRPFEGRNLVETFDAILRVDPPPMTRHDEPVHPFIDRVVRRMLAKDRSERYPRMRAVVADLEVFESERTTRSAPPVPAAEPPRSVAVVCFDNLTGAPGDDWIGAGIAETLAAELEGVPNLLVIGRERVSEAKRARQGEGAALPAGWPVAVGRELGAAWVLLGSCQRVGESLRVTARLVEVATGREVRNVKLDGRLDGLFDLQDRLARELASKPPLAAASVARPVAGPTRVFEAYEAYARGLVELRAEQTESIARAVTDFESAVALDPSFARAWLELGNAFDLQATYLTRPGLHEKALASYRRALELRPDLADGWRELGGTFLALGREAEALEAIERAIALAPFDPANRTSLGRVHFIGRGDFARAMESYEAALAQNPRAGWSALQLAHAATLARDFGKAERAARSAIALQEALFSGKEGIRIAGAYLRLGYVFALLDRHEEALVEYRREIEFLHRSDHALRERSMIELEQKIASSLHHLGRRDESDAAFRRMADAFDARLAQGADDPHARYYVASAFALRGDADGALAHLAEAIGGRPRFTVARARLDPDFDPVRSDPRFRELVGGA